MQLENKVAVITGGASGLGEATVRRFVGLGVKCAIFDLNDKSGNAARPSVGFCLSVNHQCIRIRTISYPHFIAEVVCWLSNISLLAKTTRKYFYEMDQPVRLRKNHQTLSVQLIFDSTITELIHSIFTSYTLPLM